MRRIDKRWPSEKITVQELKQALNLMLSSDIGDEHLERMGCRRNDISRMAYRCLLQQQK